MAEPLLKFLESPLFALAITLLLGVLAVSGKFSQTAAQSLLVGVWFVGSLSILRSGIVDKRLIAGAVCSVAAICLFVSYWIKPAAPSPQVPPITPTATPALEPPKPTVPTEQTKENPPTLIELFNKDFPNTGKLTRDVMIQWGSNPPLKIKQQVYLDFDAKTEFVGFYVFQTLLPPDDTRTLEACLKLAGKVDETITYFASQVEITAGYLGERTALKELTFSGRVFLYHEAFLSIPQKAEIIAAYSQKKLDVQFRGPDYLQLQLIDWYQRHPPTPKISP